LLFDFRFAGTEAEPRPNLPSGHIPGSINLPFTKLINPETGTLHPVETLRKIFYEHGIDTTKPLVMSCGSGVTASVVYLAAKEIGVKDVRVYDGSWSEWASKRKSPIQKDIMSAYTQ
jgi:thiosulfate/3-mercaptopyruvate sulfurtransferase